MARTTFIRIDDTNIAVFYNEGEVYIGLRFAHQLPIGGFWKEGHGRYTAYVNLTGWALDGALRCDVLDDKGKIRYFRSQEAAAQAVLHAYAAGQAIGALADLCREGMAETLRTELGRIDIKEDGVVKHDGVRCGHVTPHNGGYVASVGISYAKNDDGEYTIYETAREAARAVVDFYAAGRLVSAVRAALYPAYIDMANEALEAWAQEQERLEIEAEAEEAEAEERVEQERIEAECLTVEITVELSMWSISHEEREVIEVEVPADATPEQIDAAKHQAAREWVYEKVSWCYRDPEPSDYED